MGFTVQAACLSHIGNRRANNEDNFFFNDLCMEELHTGTHDPLLWESSLKREVCFAVFDGMGGENYGEQASFSAAAGMRDYLEQPRRFYVSDGKYLGEMAQALNTAVFRRAQELPTSRMGTTMAALYLTPRYAYACNVGDSRVYRLRGSTFAQMSVDHVSQRPQPAGRKAPLIQYLGMDPGEVRMEPCIVKDRLERGDIYLVCSDGLTDMVSNVELSDLLSAEQDPADCAERLLRAALDHGGRDNITLIVCRVDD